MNNADAATDRETFLEITATLLRIFGHEGRLWVKVLGAVGCVAFPVAAIKEMKK